MALWISVRPLATRGRPAASGTLLAALALLMSLTACGSASGAVAASQAVPVGDGPPISGPQSGPQSSAVPTYTAGIAVTVTAVGTVITNDGYTLYRYAKDRATPSRSTCTGGCATTWPPVVVTEPLAGTGLDPALLGTVARPDGTQQLTVDGWPVYRFVRDTAPGETKGQGGGRGAWTALGFDGRPITDDTVAEPPSASPSANGPDQ